MRNALTPEAETMLKIMMHDLPKHDLPKIVMPDEVLNTAERINLADLLDSRAFAPYTLINLLNAEKSLALFAMPADDSYEMALINDVHHLFDYISPSLKRECHRHVGNCGAVICHPNMRRPSLHVQLRDLRS